MSRWTKGELTIGEIAQMERDLADCQRRLQSAYKEPTSSVEDDMLYVLARLVETLSVMLKG